MTGLTIPEIRTLKMWGEEKTVEEMARILGRSPDIVLVEAARLGVRLKPDKRRPTADIGSGPTASATGSAQNAPGASVARPKVEALPMPRVVVETPATARALPRRRVRDLGIERENPRQFGDGDAGRLVEALRRAGAYIRRGQSLTALGVIEEALGKEKARA